MQRDSRIQQGVYRHYKGNHYEVLGLAHGTETGEKLVIYRARYETPDLGQEYGADPWFARPYEMFTGTVEVDGRTVQRFTYVPPE